MAHHFEREDVPTTAEGNTNKEAALARLLAMTGRTPDPKQEWVVGDDEIETWHSVDFTSGDYPDED